MDTLIVSVVMLLAGAHWVRRWFFSKGGACDSCPERAHREDKEGACVPSQELIQIGHSK